MDFKKEQVLLTGASGMVGRAILKVLLASHPKTFTRAVYHTDKDLLDSPQIEWVQANLLNVEDCRRVAKGCSTAIMTAAITSGSLGMSMEPWRALDDNVIMNTQMLEAFHYEGVRRAVFISSATVYQEFEGAIREDELDLNQEPHPAYLGVGWGMRFTEKLCRFWHEKTGMEVVIVRAANVYGPCATFDPQRSNVVPALIRKAVDRMDPFEVWGSPDVIRDVVYVEDFVDAVMRILEAPQVKFDVFNVGSGYGHTVGDIVCSVLEKSHHEPSEIRYVTSVAIASKVRILDCTKIKDHFDWQPTHSLGEGVRKTTEWWIRNKDWWGK